ncbi:hypothetical protein [Actinoplanes sp. NPDC049599]|uniref:hypothetical protein n=1 Tax=Actinoplanes sp. NPDC049599 TaxID=3363903 RepID=UPI0037BBFB3B
MLLHAALVVALLAGFYLGLWGLGRAPFLGTFVDLCHLALTTLGLPWSLLVSEALGHVDKGNEALGGLRELVLFLTAFLNIAVHAALLLLGREHPALARPEPGRNA